MCQSVRENAFLWDVMKNGDDEKAFSEIASSIYVVSK
jgi:hypothetical protein